MSGKLIAPWRVGVDVGGTFTDLVAVDAAGAIEVVKVSSTADASGGVRRAIEAAADRAGCTPAGFLSGCSLLIHGTTIATNTLLEGLGARVGMLTTRGFRDSIEIRRGIRENAWAHREPHPPVLCPRYLRHGVGGRLDRDGREVEPLDERGIRDAARALADEGVEAVAICLFNSFLDDAHERRAAEIVAGEIGDVPVVRSSAVAPIAGEYERGSTAVVDACLAPRVAGAIGALDRSLRADGLERPMLVLQNNGGVMRAETARGRASSLLLSGPAAGAGALALFEEVIGSRDLIAMEIGGTSCDVTVVESGRAEIASEFQIAGYHVALSTVDLHTIGAGGGTIAGTDPGGMLFVGPRGAGASPGPAAYGLGGREPTVTDAQLVLGRLEPGALADGERILDVARARAAIETRVAEPLGLALEDAAAGIITVLEQHLMHAVVQVTGERGRDPRRFVLVACGGAGPMHGAAVARALGCPAVYVPKLSGAFCALGMLNTDVRHEYVKVLRTGLEEGASALIGTERDALAARARSQLREDGFEGERVELRTELDLRYPGQVGVLRIEVPGGDPGRVGPVRERFEAEHDRQFGFIRPEAPVEVAALRVTGIGLLPRLELQRREAPRTGIEPSQWRDVHFPGGWRRTPIYDGDALGPGARLTGPCLVREATTTVVAGPGDVVEVDVLGGYLLRLAHG